MTDPLAELPSQAFARLDKGDDLAFYAPTRLVTHIDERATAALTEHYRRAILPGADVLDLMSSWVSHLPGDLPLGEVIGHGMNAAELAANPRLTRWWVRTSTATPRCRSPTPRSTRLCAVSACSISSARLRCSLRRCLRPGGQAIVSFSNRCFPTKAVAVWRALDTSGHAALVSMYLERAGFADISMDLLADGRRGDPLVAVTGRVAHP